MRVAMEWPPKLPKGSKLIIGDRGYYARIGGRQRWICGKRPVEEAERIFHRKSLQIDAGAEPMPEPEPMREGDDITLHDILNRWNIDRRGDVDRGELSPGAWQQYRLSAVRISEIAGDYLTEEILPDHIKSIYNRMAKLHGLDFAKRALGHLRTCCNHAEEFGWCKPIRFGGASIAKLMQRPAASMEWKLLNPEQIQSIHDKFNERVKTADGRRRSSLIQLRAMFLLALNGGYGAKELSDLPREVIDLENSRIDYRRGKTGKKHIVPLWTETVDALKEAMALRPKDDLLFRTREGNPWCETKPVYENGKLKRTNKTDNVNERWKEFIGADLRVKGEGFYKLKHLHATIADDAGDPHATFALAGHALPGAKSHYVKVSEHRIRKVVDYIHSVLFSSSESSQ